MEDMAAALAGLLAERSITATLYRYGEALDLGDRDEFIDCFTADSHYQVDMLCGSTAPIVFDGHEQLTGYFDSHTHAPEASHKHLTVNPLITVEGDEADVRSNFIRVDSPQAGPAVVLAAGRYVDRFQRGADGRWRISSRRAMVDNL